MGLPNFSVSWFDFAAVLVVIFGVTRGRKRGMSEELLDVLKWFVVLACAGMFYLPVASVLSESSVFSLLSCSIVTYAGIILLVTLFVSFIKRQIGDKLIGSDVFGTGEYYMGMAAGGIRYMCIVLVFMAFLNARLYSNEEIQANAAFQEQNFGSIRFPTFAGLQQEVFNKSLIGTTTRTYLSSVLIQPTAPEDKGLNRAGVVRARESAVRDALNQR